MAVKSIWKENIVWSSGYFISSVDIDEATIKRYVEHQGKKDSGRLRPEFNIKNKVLAGGIYLILNLVGKIMYLNRSAGFSLIELIVVVAVIGILAAIAIPTYLGIQKKSARSEAKSNLQAIALALEGYMAENNNYGSAGTYTYTPGGSFTPHPGNIEKVANLGNDLNYNYIIQITTAPYYNIIASPTRGRVKGDIRFSIDSNNIKVPENW